MPRLELIVPQVKDEVARDNFDRIRQYADADVFRKFEGQHFEISVNTAVTNFNWPHNLGFQPRDVIDTWKTGTGAFTWNYESFTTQYVNFTTTGPVVVRAFIGRYAEDET